MVKTRIVFGYKRELGGGEMIIFLFLSYAGAELGFWPNGC